MPRFRWHTIFFVTAIVAGSASAQEAPAFQNLRFTEDWSSVDTTQLDHWSAPLKHIELGDQLWVSIGGQQRIRYESWNNAGFNDASDDDYTLFRTHLHADFHYGDHWRVFLEGRMSTVNNRTLPGEKRAALDIDEGDFANAFIEANYEVFGADLLVRLGRQELQYGKQRLVSPLDWANNRRLFDGGVARITGDSGYTFDVFVTSPVTVNPQELTLNETNDDILFSGMYYTRPLTESTNMDAYFLARNNRHNTGAEEDRYTLGGRYFGKITDALSFDTEAAYQFGEQDIPDNDIEAWMLTVEGTYTFADTPWSPAITLGIDYATGDNDPTDSDVETFNHLFPLAHAYLGFSDVVGRQNVIDYRATLVVWPIEKTLRLRGDVRVLSLENDNDGLYSVGGGLSRPPANEDDLGLAFDFTAYYKISKYADVLLGYSHFAAGDYISDTGTDDDIDFLYLQMSYTF